MVEGEQLGIGIPRIDPRIKSAGQRSSGLRLCRSGLPAKAGISASRIRSPKSGSRTVCTAFDGMRIVTEIVPGVVTGGRSKVQRWPSGKVDTGRVRRAVAIRARQQPKRIDLLGARG